MFCPLINFFLPTSFHSVFEINNIFLFSVLKIKTNINIALASSSFIGRETTENWSVSDSLSIPWFEIVS